MPANFKPFDKNEWLRLEKKADELRRMTTIESLKVYLNRNGLDMLENKVKKSDCPLR